MPFDEQPSELAMRDFEGAVVLVQQDELDRTDDPRAALPLQQPPQLDGRTCGYRQDPRRLQRIRQDDPPDCVAHDLLAADDGPAERVSQVHRLQEAAEKAVGGRFRRKVELHEPVVACVPERLLVGTPVHRATLEQRHQRRLGVHAAENAGAFVQGSAHLVEPGDRGVVFDAPPRAQALEERGLLLRAAQGVLRTAPVELLHIEARILEKLPQIGYGRTPLGRQTLALLAQGVQSTLDGRFEMQAAQIHRGRIEPGTDAAGAPMDDRGRSCPDDPRRERHLEPLERAAGSEGRTRRGSCGEPRHPENR